MNAAAALSRMWRRLVVRLRGLRKVPESLFVPAATTVGKHQQPEGSGSYSEGHPRWYARGPESLSIDNETPYALNVWVRYDRARDQMRIRIRDV